MLSYNPSHTPAPINTESDHRKHMLLDQPLSPHIRSSQQSTKPNPHPRSVSSSSVTQIQTFRFKQMLKHWDILQVSSSSLTIHMISTNTEQLDGINVCQQPILDAVCFIARLLFINKPQHSHYCILKCNQYDVLMVNQRMIELSF